MDVPEVLSDITKITITSDTTVYIENYISVIEYNQEEILLKLKRKNLQITGSDLNIRYLTSNNMYIEGKIHSVSYL
jgi:sporulation protein YqfC